MPLAFGPVPVWAVSDDPLGTYVKAIEHFREGALFFPDELGPRKERPGVGFGVDPAIKTGENIPPTPLVATCQLCHELPSLPTDKHGKCGGCRT